MTLGRERQGAGAAKRGRKPSEHHKNRLACASVLSPEQVVDFPKSHTHRASSRGRWLAYRHFLDPECVRLASAEVVVEDAAALGEAGAGDVGRADLLHGVTTASASSSITQRESARAATTTKVLAGRISANTSP